MERCLVWVVVSIENARAIVRVKNGMQVLQVAKSRKRKASWKKESSLKKKPWPCDACHPQPSRPEAFHF